MCLRAWILHQPHPGEGTDRVLTTERGARAASQSGPRAVITYHHRIFDADPSTPGKIHAGLDGHTMPASSVASDLAADAGRLMDLQPHPVAKL